MDWKDVYKLPLKNFLNVKAFTANGVMAFDYKDWSKPDKYYQNILDIVNGDKDSNFDGNFTVGGCNIYLNDKPFLVVRGWGHLTGTGALNLPEDEAIRIQDSFINYIISRLNVNKDD